MDGRSRYRAGPAVRRLGPQQTLELGFLLGVEQPGGGPHGPVLGHPDGVVGVEAVSRDRGRIDKAAGAGRGGGAESVQRAVDVDRPDRLTWRGTGHQERQVHHYVSVAERVPQGLRVADVAAPVLHLRPAVGGRVERAPGDAHDARHPFVGLQQGHQAEPESTGRAGHRDRQILFSAGHRNRLPVGKAREPAQPLPGETGAHRGSRLAIKVRPSSRLRRRVIGSSLSESLPRYPLSQIRARGYPAPDAAPVVTRLRPAYPRLPAHLCSRSQTSIRRQPSRGPADHRLRMSAPADAAVHRRVRHGDTAHLAGPDVPWRVMHRYLLLRAESPEHAGRMTWLAKARAAYDRNRSGYSPLPGSIRAAGLAQLGKGASWTG